jgi:transketolase
MRLTEETNSEQIVGDGLVVLRRGAETAPVVVAVGPTLGAAFAATVGLDVTLAYLATVRPFDREGLRAVVRGTEVVLVEPYLAGTSSSEVSAALSDRPHRLLALGVVDTELRRYGDGAEHRAAHGLDAAGIRSAIDAWN